MYFTVLYVYSLSGLHTFSPLLGFGGKHSINTNLFEISVEATSLLLCNNSDPEEKQLAGEVSLPFFSFYERNRTIHIFQSLGKEDCLFGNVLVVMEVDKTKEFKNHVKNNDWFEVLAWFKHKLHFM